jgi:sec-independent protein translocase protein TatA
VPCSEFNQGTQKFAIKPKNPHFCKDITLKIKDMKTLLFLGNIGAGEIIIVALVILLLFGGKKIPELMKGLGKGVKSFKDGINDIEKEITAEPQKKEDKPEE